MPVGLLKDILASKPAGCPLAGIDLGAKTIGVAISDGSQKLATPLATIRRTKFSSDMEKLAAISAEYGAGGFIIGYPLNMDGTIGPASDAARSFADEMRRKSGLFGQDPWISLWDERLSTFAAAGLLEENITYRKAKEKGLVDKLAAQIILQSALDYISARNA